MIIIRSVLSLAVGFQLLRVLRSVLVLAVGTHVMVSGYGLFQPVVVGTHVMAIGDY